MNGNLSHAWTRQVDTVITRRQAALALASALIVPIVCDTRSVAARIRRRSRHLAGNATPPVVVNIAAQLTGDTGHVTLQAHARGDAAALTGRGTGIHHEFASEARFELTGAIADAVVTLTGEVTQAKFPILVGTPVEIVANATTGEVVHTFGPIAGGPLAGATLVFAGAGTIVVRG